MSEENKHKWYAIRTYAGSEESVRRAIVNLIEEHSLEDRIKEVVVPSEEVIDVKNGKKKISTRSIYSGYCFAQIDLNKDLWHKIQSMSRVSGFVSESKNPVPLSQKDVDAILSHMNKKSDPKPKVIFDQGEVVRINEGPFANFTGTVDKYNTENGLLVVNVSIFGRSTPVEIYYSQVEKNI